MYCEEIEVISDRMELPLMKAADKLCICAQIHFYLSPALPVLQRTAFSKPTCPLASR